MIKRIAGSTGRPKDSYSKDSPLALTCGMRATLVLEWRDGWQPSRRGKAPVLRFSAIPSGWSFLGARTSLSALLEATCAWRCRKSGRDVRAPRKDHRSCLLSSGRARAVAAEFCGLLTKGG